MAKEEKPAKEKKTKEPGRMRQFAQVFGITRRYDPTLIWLLLAVFLGVIAVSVAIGQFVFNGQWLSGLLIGIPLGLLAAMFIFSRRAERAMFAQIEGQAGAAGAALNTIRRGWNIEQEPVAINPRTQDVVFRAVGKPGVVLVTEGPSGRVRSLVQGEQKKLTRILPNVQIHVIETGSGEGQIPIHQLSKSMRKLKKQLTSAEVAEVSKRISSIGPKLPIPKGVDPMRARPDRKALRGR